VDAPDATSTGVARAGQLSINEDWAATVVGLALIALTLAGVIPTGLVP
jgi:hypothetical protein